MRGVGGYDAIHVACAIQTRVDALVTTDDRLMRLAERAMRDGVSAARTAESARNLVEHRAFMSALKAIQDRAAGE